MMDAGKLWYERFQAFLNLFLRYMRLIGNSGLLFSVLFLIIFGSYYYSLLIKQIPNSFPVMLFISMVMAFLLVRGKIRTFLKRADLVFLISAEERMKAYFTPAIIYNIVMQMFIILIGAIVLAPLYAVRANDLTYPYLLLIILFLLIKIWNVIVYWFALKLPSERTVFSYSFLRTVATFVLVYLSMTGASPVILLLVIVIMVAYLWHLSLAIPKEHGLKWERLIEMEEGLTLRFYRFVNAFTDVPVLKERTKPRRWVNVFSRMIRHRQSSAPLYLYTHAFIRSGNYFGIYMRLLVIGALIIIFLPYEYGKVIGYALFLYLSAVQLVALVQHFSGHDIVNLYPISTARFSYASKTLLSLLLVIKCFVFSIALLIGGASVVVAFMMLVAGALCSYLYIHLSVKKQMQS
ncbi:hypothetical protein DCC39_09165 [Pueribacillus theae]|uniref:ABC transporter permease n=1 Tax=Pueribacillus theae TaxID=2171751 RepID=A0A2U1K3S9_9BACI|nr:ABC transporter permease [Pueribacillus theae]PWA11799.1 hypothetical protein DCC39_09165 [Pueribacillus theae]